MKGVQNRGSLNSVKMGQMMPNRAWHINEACGLEVRLSRYDSQLHHLI